jgi:glucose-6-phosphate isomerase
MSSATPSLSSSAEWEALCAHVPSIERTHLRELLRDAARCRALCASHEGLFLDYSRQRVTEETMRLLLAYAASAGLQGKIASMAAGAHLNVTEDRAVLHMALRAPADAPPLLVDGADVRAQVMHVRQRVAEFAIGVRSGAILGATGKRLTNFVSIGIGGR